MVRQHATITVRQPRPRPRPAWTVLDRRPRQRHNSHNDKPRDSFAEARDIVVVGGLPLGTHLDAMKAMGEMAQERQRKRDAKARGVRDHPTGFLGSLHDHFNHWMQHRRARLPVEPPPPDEYNRFLMDTSGALGTIAFRVGENEIPTSTTNNPTDETKARFLSLILERNVTVEYQKQSYARTALLFRKPEHHTYGSNQTFCLVIIGGVVVNGPLRRRDAPGNWIRGHDPGANEAVFLVGLRANGCRGTSERVLIPSPRNKADGYTLERAALGRDPAVIDRIVAAFHRQRNKNPARDNNHSLFYDVLMGLPSK